MGNRNEGRKYQAKRVISCVKASVTVSGQAWDTDSFIQSVITKKVPPKRGLHQLKKRGREGKERFKNSSIKDGREDSVSLAHMNI